MEHREHHKRELKFFIVFIIIFFLAFILALVNLKKGIPIFGLGLPYLLEDWIVLVLSFFAIIKFFWHIAMH